ncbi:MAG: DUF2975 domain-containing protein [Lachnospiraceae bacterium]|nr:DUF2975 domain-containing protein [Lachnospiraceae bacterium]
MEQKTFSNLLKFVTIGVGICGAFVYFFLIPTYGQDLALEFPEFKSAYWPWLIFLWLTAIPCYLTLGFGWKISDNIGRDKSFSMENSKLLKWIAWMAASDSAFFFIGNVVLMFMNMNHPGIMLISLIVVFAGVTITVAAAALSHLVRKAAVLQEETELTI